MTTTTLEVLPDTGFRSRIDYANAAHDADKNLFCSFVIPKVVRISFFAERDTFAKSPRAAVVNVHNTAPCVGHEELVEFRNIEYALRFVQPLDTVNYLGLETINNLDRIVTQSGKNQQAALRIRGEMIDATRDTRRGNSLNQLQWQQFVGRRGSGGPARRCVAAKEGKYPKHEEAH